MGAPPKAPIFYLSHNPIHHLLNTKSIFTHQSIATISHKRRDMPSACFQCADTLLIASKYTTKISKENF